jgi:xanthine dehydrogenase accessory factor
MTAKKPLLVVIKGAGDLASGVAYRLFKSGFTIITTEIAHPLVVRRTVSFAEAVYAGTVAVEGITAALADSREQALDMAEHGIIPVLIDPEARIIKEVHPEIVVDAIMAKENRFTRVDVDAVIETKRGHSLGRVIYDGSAIPNTGVPGEVMGYAKERLLKAPVDGVVKSCCTIGDQVNQGDVVAYVDDTPIKAEMNGVVRGMLKDGIWVPYRTKLGDIDPRRETDCHTISDKALAIGGGVLEAVCSYLHR